MFSQRSPRNLKFERLERRNLLSANTVVEIVGETLRIIGDDGQNFVEITDVTGGIEIHTRGSNLNGLSNTRFIASKADFNKIDIRLRGDLDSVSFEDVDLNQSISIRGGTGPDVFRFTNFSNRHTSNIPHLEVFGGAERDQFIARSSWFDTLSVKLGDGNNLLSMENSRVFKTASFEMLSGYDSVFLDSNHFQRFTTIDTGDGGEFSGIKKNSFQGSFNFTAGRNANISPARFVFDKNDVGRDMKVKLGDERNQAVISANSIQGHLVIHADPMGLSAGDANEIRVSNTSIGNLLVINGGSGSDFISVSRVDVGGDLKLRGFAGHDEIKVRRTEIAGDAIISLDVGNDELLVDHVFSGGKLAINGSHGNDLIFTIGNEVSDQFLVEGGVGDDELFSIYLDVLAESIISGGTGDDYIFAFANSFLSDVVLGGGGGVNEYSAGLADESLESNFFLGTVMKKNLVAGVSIDFRSILAGLRESN